MDDNNQKIHLLDADGKPVTGRENRASTIVPVSPEVPENIFIVPVTDPILFPGMTLPLMFRDEALKEIMDQAGRQGSVVGFAPRLEPEDPSRPEPESSRVFDSEKVSKTGVIARILKSLNLPDGNRSYFISCFSRFRIVKVIRYLFPPIAKVELVGDEMPAKDIRLDAMWKAARQTLAELVQEIPGMPETFGLTAANIDNPGQLTDFVAAHLDINRSVRLRLAQETRVQVRLPIVLEILTKELQMVKLATKIREDIRQKVEKSQKEYYLREQLKAIRRELGEEVDQKEVAIREIREAIEKEQLPDHARERTEDEIRRMEILSPDSPEYGIVRTYLDWLVSMPWTRHTKDNKDMKKARRILEADHYGLKEVKERILEFLAVHKLNPDQHGAILCFVGPPGTGKTSMGQSIARALGRKFYRFSLGGMRDEAEIKGHRRTYIGAMPGKILQGLKYVGVRNPVFMLDEIDKLGSDWRGDPSSAMLEVLDPAQNSGFLDHYIDIQYDLSKVMFLCTANSWDDIPAPLFDRMEIIELPGYIQQEKVEIAARYLVPRRISANGLKKDQVRIAKPVLSSIVDGWTSEAGVRELERKIGKICRKVAARVAAEESRGATIHRKDLQKYLGPKEYITEVLKRRNSPGLAVGLAWTSVGGEIMFIETTKMPGKGIYKVTGQLGDVMEESTQIAMSYVRAHQKEYDIDPAIFERSDIHVHFPSGAVPKDGPSAGITIVTAIISLLGWKKGRKVKQRLAITGEMTLRGDVLEVGGIKEKVLGAKRAGVREIIMPRENMRNVKDIPAKVIRGLKFHYVSHYKEVAKIAFPTMPGKVKAMKKRKKK